MIGLRLFLVGDVEDIVSSQEQRAEAGELLGLQRLYVTTALSNQPRGELSKPPEVHPGHPLVYMHCLLGTCAAC